MSGVRIDGRPAAATMMSARLVYVRQESVAGVHTVTVAFACGSFSESRIASGRPMREPAPDDHDVLALDRDLVVREQRLDPERRARDAGRGTPMHELPEVHRMQPVGVLVGIDREQRGFVVEVRRQRELHEYRVDGGIVVVLRDDREQIVLA